MKVEVKVIREAQEDRNRQALSMQVHNRRGDTFNVANAKDVMEGDTETFILNAGSKLIISTPHAEERPVYDRDSGAAVYMSRQNNSVGADIPVGGASGHTGKPTRAELDAELAKLPGTYHDPDYVTNSMRAHWGDVFTEDDEKVVRSRVQPRTPPQGGRVGGTSQGVHSVAAPGARDSSGAGTGSAPQPGSGVSANSGPGVSAPVKSNESPNSPASANTTSATPSTAGVKPSGGNTEKK